MPKFAVACTDLNINLDLEIVEAASDWEALKGWKRLTDYIGVDLDEGLSAAHKRAETVHDMEALALKAGLKIAVREIVVRAPETAALKPTLRKGTP